MVIFVDTREEYVRDNVNAAARGQLCGTTLIRPSRPQYLFLFLFLFHISFYLRPIPKNPGSQEFAKILYNTGIEFLRTLGPGHKPVILISF